MATIYKEIAINSPADKVWQSVRDFGALRERLVPGFVTDCRLETDPRGPVRVVTFFNGSVVRELLVGLNDPMRRLAYTVIEGRAIHHNASVQVFADGAAASRFVWITDVVPDDFVGPIGALVEQGAVTIKQTLER